MGKVLKGLYDSLEEPVIIYDRRADAYHSNRAFARIFGDENFNKVVNKFHFDICILENEDLKTYTPISAALSSKYDYCSAASFQRDNITFEQYIIKAVTIKNLKIIYFYDITKEILLERLEAENEKLKIQNQEFASTSSMAQNQAVKMGLLNRISTSILETKDIKDLINTALKELSIIFAAAKVYFIADTNKIEYIYPAGYSSQIGEDVLFDDNTQKDLAAKKISAAAVMKEHQGIAEHLKSPLTRIVMPSYSGDNLMGYVVVLTSKKDISEVEKELLTSICVQITNALLKMQLFEKINFQNEELENTLKKLRETQLQLINSEKMASLGQLIASVAHEINTPLASISANNEMRQKASEMGEEGLELIKEFNEIDTDAIKRINNLVQSLKRFVRLDEDIQQQADINAELDLTLNILRHKTKDKIEIVKNYAQVPFINCYPNMLNQVFLNLLMNSIQAGASKITTSTFIEKDDMCILISDNGCGISEDCSQKIFHAGFTTKKVGEGTGLGLAICKKIIEKHQGDISFTSAGGTTEFKVKIPL